MQKINSDRAHESKNIPASFETLGYVVRTRLSVFCSRRQLRVQGAPAGHDLRHEVLVQVPVLDVGFDGAVPVE